MIRRVEDRLERQARNEALMRSVNEQIAELSGSAAGWAHPEQPFDFQCECGAEGSESRVVMSRAAYERVHGQRDRFAVAPGHQEDAIEYVVEENDSYVIVEAPDYAFPHAADDESRRLELFQHRLDPLTIRRIERLAVGPGAACPGSQATD